jgi:hypothetical protein
MRLKTVAGLLGHKFNLNLTPLQSGRVFKDKKELTVWVSDDENRLPIQIKETRTSGRIYKSRFGRI